MSDIEPGFFLHFTMKNIKLIRKSTNLKVKNSSSMRFSITTHNSPKCPIRFLISTFSFIHYSCSPDGDYLGQRPSFDSQGQEQLVGSPGAGRDVTGPHGSRRRHARARLHLLPASSSQGLHSKVFRHIRKQVSPFVYFITSKAGMFFCECYTLYRFIKLISISGHR